MSIKLNDVSKIYNNLNIFKDLNLFFEDKNVTVILGPSGCGKTTLLNIISGLTKMSSGQIIRKEYEKISYIFQEPRLLPWKTVKENVEFVCQSNYLSKDNEIDRYISVVNMEKYKNLYPSELSGGMQQRTSIARAFAYDGDMILMDEPFKTLDLSLKLNIIKSFIELWRSKPVTTIFVTHDIHEALLLGNKIYIMSKIPSQVIGEFDIHKPIYSRSLSDSYLIDFEKKILNLIIE